VMSRHTEEDGETSDERIVEGVSFDEWQPKLAPPGKLVGAYLRKEISWEEYEAGYLEYLRSEKMKPIVEAFAKRCAEEPITLVCVEETAENCHRRLLAEELQKYKPDLKIIHK
jgi:uncharacterized protein YeaO (DUF488 family)